MVSMNSKPAPQLETLSYHGVSLPSSSYLFPVGKRLCIGKPLLAGGLTYSWVNRFMCTIYISICLSTYLMCYNDNMVYKESQPEQHDMGCTDICGQHGVHGYSQQ